MSTPAVPRREVSPVTAAEEALAQTRRNLFPFQLERWLTLGLIAFLNQCGRGGLTLPAAPGRMGNLGGPALPDLSVAHGWLLAHLFLLVGLAAAAMALLVGSMAVVLWVGSRATFVYLDAVATARCELSRPWAEHAELAQSYFAWRFGVAMATLTGMLLLGAVFVVAVLHPGDGVMEVMAALEMVAALLLLFVLLLASGLATFALHEFVAPLQMAGRSSCEVAVRQFLALCRADPGAFLLYAVLKLAFGMAVGMVFLVLCCLTCCLGLLPVVAQTILQPVYYFDRAWSLHFLRALGVDLLRAR